MKRSALYLLAAVLLLAAVGVVVYRTRHGGSAKQPGGPGGQPVAGTGPARVLLNEILFQPVSGQPQWVELVNAGGEPGTLDGVVLENQAGGKFALPNNQTLPAGGVLLVRFDGQTGADASTVHAAPPTFLAAEGVIQLNGSQGPLDRIAWGDSQPAAANLSRGGYQDALTPGTSLGRVPRTITSDPLEWISYAPRQTTPGQPNPQPGVEILLPMDGAIVTAGTVSLTWYTVAGAARYRVQLAADPAFGSPLVDQTADAPPIATPALAPGSYVWRVQAISTAGTTADYSPPSALTVRAARGAAAGRGRWLLDWLLPAVHAQSPQQPTIDDQLPTVLDVPLIQQHKDTAMLLVDRYAYRDTAGIFGHAWDMDHGDLATWDWADNMNCAPASVAMLSQYYKERFHYTGRLSQDRINYEMFHADVPGPQGDLNWGRSYNRERLTKAMAFAFGVPPRIDPPFDDEVLLRATWKARIEQGMPGIACKNRHCVAVVGVGGSPALLVLNDPASRGTYLAPLSFLRDATVFVMARPDSADPSFPSAAPMLVRPQSDEPEVSRDSDGDGVVDFDEIHRFHTNPKLKDTDQDGVPDKEDIRASVHDKRHGFAYGGPGRDFDGDSKMMELDEDADNGGCFDGMEDTNGNGKFEPELGEFDNFDPNDDACVSGSYVFVQDSLFRNHDGSTQKLDQRQSIQFSFREIDGVQKGRAMVTASYRQELTDPSGTHGCGNSVESTEPYQYVVDVQANVVKMPDGTVSVSVGPPAGWTPPMMRHVSTCPGVPPFEAQAGLNPRIGGVLRNGVFDERVDLPLDREGGTGTKYYETHIRQSTHR